MRVLMALVFVGSAAYLYLRHKPEPPPPAPVLAHVEPPTPLPVVAVADFEKVRKSAADNDPEVRWAAVQLLFALRDPEVMAIIERVMTNDPEPDLRLKAVAMLRASGSSATLPSLVKGLKDMDKTVRIASLKAIGDIGDPSAAPWVTESLKDYEPEVRVAALQALSRFQDKRTEDFRRLAEKLKRDYEDALKHRQEEIKKKELGG